MRALIVTAMLATAGAFGWNSLRAAADIGTMGNMELNGLIDNRLKWTPEATTVINGVDWVAGISTHPFGQIPRFVSTLVPSLESAPVPSLEISLTPSNSVQLEFSAEANTGYLIEYRDSLTSGAWQPLAVLDPVPSVHKVRFADPPAPATPMRFYRVRSTASTTTEPAQGNLTDILALAQTAGSKSLSTPREAAFSSETGPVDVSWNRSRKPARGVLSAEAAGDLARRLANEQALSLYKCQPFQGRSPARPLGGGWVWRDRRGVGAVDIEAEVRFGADGASPSVNVIVLDSRALEVFRR